MANFVQGFAALCTAGDTLAPETITATTNGAAVDVGAVGANMQSAVLSVGAVSGTAPTLDVKIQASPDGSSNWADVSGATFSQVTTASHVALIDFQLPTVTDPTAAAYRYVRAVATVGGTSPSFALHCVILGSKRYDGANVFYNAPPAIN